MDGGLKSSSTSVSPPTPDTPVQQPSPPPPQDSSPLDAAGVALNMQRALDAAATETPDEPAATAPHEATLWDILGIPPPVVGASQHASLRVVLVGRALSGKRTLCRRLCLAAERQYPSSQTDDDDERHRLRTLDLDGERRGLYWPTEGVDDLEETEEWPEDEAGRRLTNGRHDHTHASEVPHGAGISHDYVVQRLPRPIQDPLTGVQRTHRTVEFFCCDSAGALAMAMPTLASLDAVVICHVVDVSQPCSIEDQLNSSFSMVQTHVASLLRTFLPSQDEVRRVQMMQKTEDLWLREEVRLRRYRETVQSRNDDETLVAPGVKLDAVNQESLRLPRGTQTVSSLRAVIVCTKTDVLQQLSKACSTEDVPITEEERALMDALIPETMYDAMQAMACTLPALVAQLVRHYAIQHRCALVAVSSRVNTLSAPATGEQVPLVNPLYRTLWEYMCYLQQCTDGTAGAAGTTDNGSSAVDAAAEYSADVLTQACTATFYPSAFIPCGLDSLGLLSEFVSSGRVTLTATDPMHVESPPPHWDHTAALKRCALEHGFHTHQAHLQSLSIEPGARDSGWASAPDTTDWLQRAGTATSGRSEPRTDEPLLWDTL